MITSTTEHDNVCESGLQTSHESTATTGHSRAMRAATANEAVVDDESVSGGGKVMALFRHARKYGIIWAVLFTASPGVIAATQSPWIAWRVQASRVGARSAVQQEEPFEWREETPDGQPEDPWKDEQLVRPEELLKRMSSVEKPFVLHIGVASLFRNSHIPGSKYAGQGSTPDGIEKLKQTVQGVRKNGSIVLYCGCCPWKDCPNIRPAFKALREMGFTRVLVLNLPNSFSQDWISKRHPVERGEAGK